MVYTLKICHLIINLDSRADRHQRAPSQNVERMSESTQSRTDEAFNEGNLVTDPISDKGIIKYLLSVQQRIVDLKVSIKKLRSPAQIALIKSKSKMRRKSDVSHWSGGVSRLEQTTSFLVQNYVPAIAIHESLNKKELSAAALVKNHLDAILSSKNRLSAENPPLSMIITERKSYREKDDNKDLMTIMISDSYMRVTKAKEVKVISLETEFEKQKDNRTSELVKEILRTTGLNTDPKIKPKLVMINEENLHESLNEHINASVSCEKNKNIYENHELKSDLPKKISEVAVVNNYNHNEI